MYGEGSHHQADTCKSQALHHRLAPLLVVTHAVFLPKNNTRDDPDFEYMVKISLKSKFQISRTPVNVKCVINGFVIIWPHILSDLLKLCDRVVTLPGSTHMMLQKPKQTDTEL